MRSSSQSTLQKISISILFSLAAIVSIGFSKAIAQNPKVSTQNILVERKHQLGYLVVTPQGPKDGGDFGPHTPGTKTSGLQEVFDRAKQTTQDVYIAGGNLTFDKNQGVVYFLDETLRIPWMQDFRLDGGEYVIQYNPKQGDAIVIDSQMSCHYKFGIISSNSDGSVFRIKPTNTGPDRFQVFTTTNLHINALVGGGGSWMGGEAFSNELDQQHDWRGIGLWLDASKGSINDNQITVMEIVGCHTAMLLTGRSSDNWIKSPFLHLSQTHLQLGTKDDHTSVTNNRIQAAMDGQGISKSVGARIFGSNNLLELTSAQTSPNNDLIFEAPAKDNLVRTSHLPNGISNHAIHPTNRLIYSRAEGFSAPTPPIPPTGQAVTNREATTVEIMIIQAGKVSSWTLKDTESVSQQFQAPLRVGQSIRLAPGETIELNYSAKPQWRWRAVPN